MVRNYPLVVGKTNGNEHKYNEMNLLLLPLEGQARFMGYHQNEKNRVHKI
jgi:hypothetical protein